MEGPLSADLKVALTRHDSVHHHLIALTLD